mmetsp:Transcript_42246/g.122567  ORF Transcript_42246/g.122567 Transcript_42246/m.122567 type:complete len:306 (-) Transcript_42246:1785-2702(-)
MRGDLRLGRDSELAVSGVTEHTGKGESGLRPARHKDPRSAPARQAPDLAAAAAHRLCLLGLFRPVFFGQRQRLDQGLVAACRVRRTGRKRPDDCAGVADVGDEDPSAEPFVLSRVRLATASGDTSGRWRRCRAAIAACVVCKCCSRTQSPRELQDEGDGGRRSTGILVGCRRAALALDQASLGLCKCGAQHGLRASKKRRIAEDPLGQEAPGESSALVPGGAVPVEHSIQGHATVALATAHGQQHIVLVRRGRIHSPAPGAHKSNAMLYEATHRALREACDPLPRSVGLAGRTHPALNHKLPQVL